MEGGTNMAGELTNFFEGVYVVDSEDLVVASCYEELPKEFEAFN